MAKIGVMIDNFFEDVEYTRPVKAFKDAGHQITNLGIKLSTVKSKKGTATVEIDERIRDSD